jgi:hypothetical protein
VPELVVVDAEFAPVDAPAPAVVSDPPDEVTALVLCPLLLVNAEVCPCEIGLDVKPAVVPLLPFPVV